MQLYTYIYAYNIPRGITVETYETGMGLSDQKLCPDPRRSHTQCICCMLPSWTSYNHYWFWRWYSTHMALHNL